MIGRNELIIIVVVVLILFGARAILRLRGGREQGGSDAPEEPQRPGDPGAGKR